MNRSRKSTSPRKSPTNRSSPRRTSNQGARKLQGPTRRRSFSLHNASERRRRSSTSNASIRRRRSQGGSGSSGSGSNSREHVSFLRFCPDAAKMLGGLKQRSFNHHNASFRKNERESKSFDRRFRSGAPMVGKHKSFNLHNASRKKHDKFWEDQKNFLEKYGDQLVHAAMNNFGRDPPADPNDYLHWSDILNEDPPSFEEDIEEGPISPERYLELRNQNQREIQRSLAESAAIRRISEDVARRQDEEIRQMSPNDPRRQWHTMFWPRRAYVNDVSAHPRDPGYNDWRGPRTSSPILNTRDARDIPEHELSPIAPIDLDSSDDGDDEFDEARFYDDDFSFTYDGRQ